MVLLTKKLILSRARAQDLNGVKNLNCWGSELTDVTILKDVPNVEVINASVNEIENLEGFSSCHNLKELYLRRNKIKSVDELLHLADLKNLRFLWLSGNPFCESLTSEDYRQSVIKILPQIQKLDNAVVTSSELQRALQSTLESRDVDSSIPEAEETTELNLSEPALKSTGLNVSSKSSKSPLMTNSLPDVPENPISKSLDFPASKSSPLKEMKSPNVSIPRSLSPDLPKLSRSFNTTNSDIAEVAISISIDDSESSTPTASTSRPLPVPGQSAGDTPSASTSQPCNEAEKAINSSLPVEDSLEETNKLRCELGLQPISLEKYNLSVSQPFKPPKKHKKNTPKNNILRASLALIEELDVMSLLKLQDAIQEKLEEFELESSPEEATRELLPS